MSELIYKRADSPEEFEQIHRLNYQTFVEEIPQHEKNEYRQLVDRFHEENTYLIAKDGEEVVGMVAIRAKRPFSLDEKLGNVDSYLPEGSTPCEVRLLSVKEAYRGSRVFYGLCEKLVAFCLEQGYDTALISGTDRQTRLYRHLGFQPFGPAAGTEAARYQPMLLTKERFGEASRLLRNMLDRTSTAAHSFLPGPVPVRSEVKSAWCSPAVSHRSSTFCRLMEEVQERLCALTGARHAEVIVGTGTLANDLIAAQLSLRPEKGLILSSGEFGERLIGQAKRWQLSFAAIRKPWNAPITLAEVEEMLLAHPPIRYLWTVHSETSTGYVYPLNELKTLCAKYDVRLCVDACSSAGVFPVDLAGVDLASGVSGKGFGSYPGLAVVFHENTILSDSRLPASLDLGRFAENGSVPSTHSSNGLMALNEALKTHQYTDPLLTEKICTVLKRANMDLLCKKGYSPGIVSIVLPETIPSRRFGDELARKGIRLSYESRYLLERNWIQLAIMGEHDETSALLAVKEICQLYQQLTEKPTRFAEPK